MDYFRAYSLSQGTGFVAAWDSVAISKQPATSEPRRLMRTRRLPLTDFATESCPPLGSQHDFHILLIQNIVGKIYHRVYDFPPCRTEGSGLYSVKAAGRTLPSKSSP